MPTPSHAKSAQSAGQSYSGIRAFLARPDASAEQQIAGLCIPSISFSCFFDLSGDQEAVLVEGTLEAVAEGHTQIYALAPVQRRI